tara:strand:+ start:1107 stop:2033 length:927 start_codon:yes stop_codon:yes gene_type:complete
MNLKKLKVLIFGFGSIAKKHATVLRGMGINQIYVYSKQKKVPFMRVNNFNEIVKINPDYLIIASHTSSHFNYLSLIEKKMKKKLILVEKPLFDKFKKLKIKNNKVFVGYNLRFHPALQLIKKKIKNKKIWYASAICGSYLPEWRKTVKYYHSHSSKKRYGGGVLLELSHELDYFLWFFKNFEIRYAYNKKISNLKVNTDDILELIGKNSKINYLNIKLNYFYRKPIRTIFIEGNNISIKANLIKHSLSVMENEKEKKYTWPQLNALDLYKKEHKNLLKKRFKHFCTYREGLNVMRLIDKIKKCKKKFI